MTVVERACEVAGNPVLAGLSGFSRRSFGWIFAMPVPCVRGRGEEAVPAGAARSAEADEPWPRTDSLVVRRRVVNM
jgi:hypothetical protein